MQIFVKIRICGLYITTEYGQPIVGAAVVSDYFGLRTANHDIELLIQSQQIRYQPLNQLAVPDQCREKKAIGRPRGQPLKQRIVGVIDGKLADLGDRLRYILLQLVAQIKERQTRVRVAGIDADQLDLL